MRKKFTMLLATFLVCLGGVKAETKVITDLNQLSNDKAYLITPKEQNRGSLSASENDTYLERNTNINTDNPALQFAIIKYDDKYYLYSIAAKKFTCDEGKYISLKESPIGNHVVIESATETGYFIFKLGGNDLINISTGWQHGALADWNDQDGGNQFTITEVGDVVLSEVIALFSNTVEVTYKYYVGETFIKETTVKVGKGADFPAADAVPGYVTTSGVPTGQANKTDTFNIQCTLTTDFPFSTTTYFGLTLRNGAKWLIGTENGQELTTTGLSIANVDQSDAYSWIVEGTWYGGFYFKNKGTGKYLAAPADMSNGAATVMIDEKAESAKFCIDMISSKYYIRQYGTKDNCVSDWGGGANASLKFWSSSANYGDAGSQFVVVNTEPQNLLNAFKHDYSATVGYAGGYDVNDAIINNLTLDNIAEFLAENKVIELTPGYYYIKGTGTGNNANWYASYGGDNFKATESEQLGQQFIWKFESVEGGYKLRSIGANKYAGNLVAAAATTQLSELDGGTYTFTNNGTAKFTIKNGDNVMRTEGDGRINYWGSENNETWYLVPVTDEEMSLCGYVAKVGTEYYKSFDDAYAYAAVKENETIELLATVVLNPDADKTYENVAVKAKFGDVAFRVQGGNTVTFKDMNVESNDYCFIVGQNEEASNLIINGGSYKGATSIASVTKGNLAIISGTFEVEPYQGNYNYTINCIDANYKNDEAKVAISGGTFYNFNPADNAAEGEHTNFLAEGYAAANDAEGWWTVADAVAKVGNQYYTSLEDAIADAEDGAIVTLLTDITLNNYIDIRKEVTINLNEHSITHPSTSTATYKDVFEVYTNGRLTIVGDGSVIAEDGYSIYATGDAIVNINGGYYFSSISVIDARKDAQVTINGGTFKVDGSNNPDGDYGQKYTLNLRDKEGKYESDKSQIIVKGGEFYKYNPAVSESEPSITNFVAVGYSSINEGDFYVVSQGIKNELALKAAIAAAEAGTTVTLDKDIELSDAITIDNDITLDLGGKTITRAEGYVFEVTGELTVTGEGSIAEGGICYIINDADYKTEAGKTYAISEDKVNVDIQYTRTFGHTNWQVLFVPFDIPLESMTDFEVYGFTEMNDENTAIIVEKVTGNLNAHTPYFIKANKTGEKTITVTNAKLEATTAYEHNYGNYTLHGTYTSMAIQDHREYVLSNGQWVQMENAGSPILGAFRLYLTANNGNDAPALRIVTRGETGIEELSTVNDQQSTVIYDLTGRKVETMDKGIYIVNGRKVVIK